MKSTNVIEKIKEEVERFNASFDIEDAEQAKVQRNESSMKIEDLTDEVNKLFKLELYSSLMSSDNAMLSAIETLYCPRFKVRNITNDDGVITSMSVFDDKGNLNLSDKIIDLVDFDRYAGFTLANERGWQYSLERFGQLMTLKVAFELGLPSSKIDTVAKTYYLSKVAEKIKQGETPTSNTKALKELQYLIDMIIYEDDNGKNKYKATSHDVAYIDKLIAKRGKSALTVSVVNSRIIRELVTAVLYRIVTNKGYDIDYKKKKA